MADFATAYAWMMDNEDEAREYANVPDAPPGARAISGINSEAFPVQFAAIAAIAQANRGPAVQNFYESQFWNSWFAQLTSDDLAKRVFDESVNAGEGTAVKLMQMAISPSLTADGCWGPKTVAAANSGDYVTLFISLREQHYRNIAAANPADEKYLDEWLARAKK